MLFFEADTGGGQIGGVNQPHRPRLPGISGKQWGQHSLIKSSRMNGFKSSSKAVVPVAGRSEFMAPPYRWKSNSSASIPNPVIPDASIYPSDGYTNFRNTLLKLKYALSLPLSNC